MSAMDTSDPNTHSTSDPNPRRYIDIVANPKGGTGKTTFTLALIYRLRKARPKSQPTSLCEMDSQGKLSRFYPNETTSIRAALKISEIREDPNKVLAEIDGIGAKMIEGHCVVDLGANTGETFWNWWDHRRMNNLLEKKQRKARFWIVTTDDTESLAGALGVAIAAKAAQQFHQIIFVQNQLYGPNFASRSSDNLAALEELFRKANPTDGDPVEKRYATNQPKSHYYHLMSMPRCYSELWTAAQAQHFIPAQIHGIDPAEAETKFGISEMQALAAVGDYQDWIDTIDRRIGAVIENVAKYIDETTVEPEKIAAE
jgi:hypothetical protein